MSQLQELALQHGLTVQQLLTVGSGEGDAGSTGSTGSTGSNERFYQLQTVRLRYLNKYLLQQFIEHFEGESRNEQDFVGLKTVLQQLSQLEHEQLWTYFRFLVNTREPVYNDKPEFLQVQDTFLQEEIRHKGVVKLEELTSLKTAYELYEQEQQQEQLTAPAPQLQPQPQLQLQLHHHLTPQAREFYLGMSGGRVLVYRGDITCLQVDAIVNAANEKLLGCFVPQHHCIDNAIHTFAGVQMRAECDRLMQADPDFEPVGNVKVTSGFNLPCKCVIHTVGPRGAVGVHEQSPETRQLLINCYRNSIEAALKHKCHSIALCCISTGVFSYPRYEAAAVALNTVAQTLQEHAEHAEYAEHTSPDCGFKVVFDLFDRRDYEVYMQLLGNSLRAP